MRSHTIPDQFHVLKDVHWRFPLSGFPSDWPRLEDVGARPRLLVPPVAVDDLDLVLDLAAEDGVRMALLTVGRVPIR